MKQEKLGLLAMDSLCAGTLSVGAALVLLPAFGLLAQWPLITVAAVLLLGMCALCERKPWVPLAVAASIALVGCGAAALLGIAGTAVANIIGYCEWAVGETINGTPQLTVYLVCMLPIVLVFWVLTRNGTRWKQPCLWAVTLLAGGLIGYKAVRMPEGWLPPFMLLCAGVILYLPRANLGKEGRLQAQILAAALTVPVLGLCLLLGPKEDGQWRSRAVGYLVQDTQDFWEFHWGELPSLPLTSMRSMGLQPETDRLGGDIDPSDSLAISGDKPVLLRGQTLEVYTGSGWQDGQENDGNFRYESLIWQGRKRKAFGLDGPPQVSKPLLDELLSETTVTLHTQRNFRSLFLPYRTESVELIRSEGDLYFDMQGEAYWNRQPHTSVEYRVKCSAWNYRDRDSDRNMLFLEEALRPSGTDPEYEQAAARCLQLPDSLPEWVRSLASELTGECISPYEKAMALRDYLSENCQYTRTPGPADDTQDFVAGFLTDRKGYCTYYASALTVLCRCADIPARYVTGYGMIKNGQRYAATSATAHAWTEIYLEHMGWVPLDALGQEIFETERQEATSGGDASYGQPVIPSPTPGPVDSELWTVAPEDEGFDPLALLWGLPAALAIGWALGARLLRTRRYTLGYVHRRYQKNSPAAEHCYAGMLRLLRLRGQRPREGETLLGFWQRVAETLPDSVDWQETGRVMDRLRFGGREPEDSEIAFLCETYTQLLNCTRKGLGIRGWFV